MGGGGGGGGGVGRGADHMFWWNQRLSEDLTGDNVRKSEYLSYHER